MLSSCGFSPFKTAFAATFPADLPTAEILHDGVADIAFYNVPDHPGLSWSDVSYGTNPSFSEPFTYYVGISAGAFYLEYDIPSWFYLNSSCVYTFSGVYRFGSIPVTDVYLKFYDDELSSYLYLKANITIMEGSYYYELKVDASEKSSLALVDVDFYFTSPLANSGQFGVPADSTWTGTSQYGTFSLSSLRWSSVSEPMSSTDIYQDDVISGLDDIQGSIDSGFDSVQGEIQSGSQDVVDAVDGVTDAVGDLNSTAQEWGQNIVNGITEGATAIQKTITEESEKLGNFILDGLKSLFIPRDGYFKELFDDLNSFFSEVFGFLYFPIEHALSWFNRLLNLPEVAPSIAIPELAYEGEVLIPAQTYTFDFLQDEPFLTVHDYYLMAIDAAMIMSFVHLLQRKYEEVMRN